MVYNGDINEQETSVSIVPTDRNAIVYSSEPRMMKRMEKLLKKYPTEVGLYDIASSKGVVTYLSICVPKDWIRIRRPRRRGK